MSAIWALARKDLKLLLRDKAGFFFTFIFPVLFAIFFGWILGGTGGGKGQPASAIKVVLVDDDKTDGSRAFVKTLADATELDEYVTELAAAEQDVRNGKVVAMIRLMPGFGAGQENLFWRDGGQSQIEVAADPSKKAEVAMLQGVLQKYAFSGMSKAFTDPDVSRRQIAAARRQLQGATGLSDQDREMFSSFFGSMDSFMGGLDRRAKEESTKPAEQVEGGFAFEPVKIVQRDLFKPKSGQPTNRFTYTFPQGIVWGLMGAALGFAASLHAERAGGTYARLAASPLPVWGVLAGKGLACFITMLGVTVLMIGVAVLLCGVTIEHPLRLAAGVFCVALGFVGIMLLVAALTRTERAAQGGGWGVMMVLAFIGGAAIPSFVFPKVLQQVSQVSPMYWSIRAFDSGLWRPMTPTEAALPLVVMVAVGVIGFALAAFSTRRA